MTTRSKVFAIVIPIVVLLFVILGVAIHKESQSFDEYATPEQSLAALKKNPNDLAAHRELADYYTMQRQYEEAISELRKINSIDPQDRVDLLQLGNILGVAGHKEEALTIFNRLAQGNDSIASSAKKYIAKYTGTTPER